MSFEKPPIYVPPPSPYKPTSSTPGLIVLVILGAFVVILLLTGLAYLAVSLFGPRMRADGGVVGTPIQNGWYRYHIPALSLTLAGYTKPIRDTQTYDTIRSRKDISEYAAYRMNRGHLAVLIAAYWMRWDNGTTLQTMADFQEQSLKRQHPDATSVHQTEMTVDGHPAIDVTVEFPWDKKYPWVAECIVVIDGKVHYYFEGDYWKASAGPEKRSWEYMIRSVKFDGKE